MLKVLHFSSETKKKFGVFKVVSNLKKNQSKEIKVKLSSNILDIFIFKPEIVHIHGCWKPELLVVFLLAKLTFTKIVVSPHGMIDPLSFAQKKTKKKLAWFIYQRYIFNFSNLIIANSEFEKKNLVKKLKFSKNIKIIKHGIDLPKKFKRLKKKKQLTFIFFSRIHPSKNLMKLVQLWKKNDFFDDYLLDVYGEVENFRYFYKFKSEIKNLKNLTYKGKINKYNLNHKLSKYDVLLHPSNSENFGLVILEAMSCGLFPIVNRKIDWQILDKNNLGYSSNFTYKDLKRFIIKLNKSKKKIRGRNFHKKLRNFLSIHYNWKLIIDNYNQYYTKLVK